MAAIAPLRWGIMGTGWISSKFVLDLLVAPATRGVSDVAHEVYAVGSRGEGKAKTFVDTYYKEAGVAGAEKVKLHSSYESLLADEGVQAIYVGTPHSHHYQNVHAALSAGKNVLCEKAFTANADQAKALVALAREKNLFLMEAVWTRFQPFAYKLQEILRSGVIGEIRSAQAELNVDFTKTAKADPSHRLVNPDLCGGSLLDLGPYPWTQLFLALMPEPSTGAAHPLPKIAASMTKTFTGVDCSTIAVIQFPQPDGRVVHGTLTTSQDSQTPHGRVSVVQGNLGYVEVQWATYRPEGLVYKSWKTEEEYAEGGKPEKEESFSFVPRPGGIWGFAWEADEVARCLRDGKKESERMPLRDTVLMMEVFDEIRKQGELVYPEAVETLELA
ncbi:NAD-binding protein [Leucosporidium creatinivorum]|uniref:D-xylose 1-dehydrogenase (NADP(+), D-xylono-1,5-lactone-forming) n=1 Tax=Leucosporidium creatinivorum TaxID=106004 RepID=A0A1Y2FWF9_9BASI|nr:NAD-binding protein [Leucosporidium creatinivorum]